MTPCGVVVRCGAYIWASLAWKVHIGTIVDLRVALGVRMNAWKCFMRTLLVIFNRGWQRTPTVAVIASACVWHACYPRDTEHAVFGMNGQDGVLAEPCHRC